MKAERVSLSFKQCGSYSVVVLCYDDNANGFGFDSHLADITFFSFFRLKG